GPKHEDRSRASWAGSGLCASCLPVTRTSLRWHYPDQVVEGWPVRGPLSRIPHPYGVCAFVRAYSSAPLGQLGSQHPGNREPDALCLGTSLTRPPVRKASASAASSPATSSEASASPWCMRCSSIVITSSDLVPPW